MKLPMKYILLVILIIIAIGCQEGAIEPQEPMWGKEPCSACRMILSEKRYAVQRILKSGEIHFYDDINCAMKHDHEESDGKLYVYPEGENKWVPAEESGFEGGLSTPMNSGHGAVKGGPITLKEIKEKFKE